MTDESRTKCISRKFPNLELERSTLAGTGEKTIHLAGSRVRSLKLKLDKVHRNTQRATVYTGLLFFKYHFSASYMFPPFWIGRASCRERV